MKGVSIVIGVCVLVVVFVVLLSNLVVQPSTEHSKIVINGVPLDIEIADTQTARAQGLSGRKTLGEHEGMLFVFDTPGMYGFWMREMLFPIDIVWIRDNVVIGVTENVMPESESQTTLLTQYYPPTPVTEVLELVSGRAKTIGIQGGTIIERR